MKDRKINVDRPQLKAEEILQGKDFEAVVRNHQFMSKPFYKQTWFYGTTGLASLGIIVGGLALQSSNSNEEIAQEFYETASPPALQIAYQSETDPAPREANSEQPSEKDDKTIEITSKNISPIEDKITQTKKEEFDQSIQLEQPEDIVVDEEEKQEVELNSVDDESVVNHEKEMVKQPKSIGRMDMYPRISDKMGGEITRNELFDNKGITTEGDISIIHFELHLIDGLGGQVYAQEGNKLNHEMKQALEKVGQGETIYFENIRGKIKNGTEIKLSPLRYVLLN